LQFQLYPLRFSFSALDAVYFPPGKSSNLLRGAFGTIFRRLVCVPECAGARMCELRATCPYARMFEPSALGAGPSGFQDWPRPFVFRATHLDGSTVRPGSRFHFDLNLFDMKSPALAYLVLSFAQLAHDGLGPGRGRARLAEVSQLGADGGAIARLYDGQRLAGQRDARPLTLSLSANADAVSRVRVHFVTPMELKSGHEVVSRPEFGVLAARIRDRVSKLRELYGEGPLEMDFRAFGQRAATVRMVRCEFERVDVERRSAKTGHVHPMGGFVGAAEYEGDVTEFVPWLGAARWTGVGRQTVWGKGEVEAIAC
jgi:hypothetical protein